MHPSPTLARSVAPVVLALCVVLAAPAAVAQSVFINEFHYDNVGADTGEFVEVAGPAGTDLAGWRISLYNGNGGGVYGTINLEGVIDDEGDGFGALAFFPSTIQNGPPGGGDGFALVDADGAVVQFISYEGTVTATAGPAEGQTSTDVGVDEQPATAVGNSLQLKGAGTTYGDFAWAEPSPESPGRINDGQTFEGDDEPDPIACALETPLSFDFDGDGNGRGSDVMADDFDTTGSDPTFGEFVGVRHEAEGAPPVDLSTCSFVAFDPFSERVVYSARTTGTVEPGTAYVLATTGGDQDFGQPDVLIDSPGAFALVVGTAAVGDDVTTVSPRVVAAVVYDRNRGVFGSVGGGATTADQAGFASALAAIATGATSAEGGPSELAVAVAPNPLSGRGAVSFTLPAAADVRVTLYDALGRQVAVLAEGPHGAGPHSADLSAAALPAGVYIVRAVLGTEATTVRLTVAR